MSFDPGVATTLTPASGADSVPLVWKMRSRPGSRSVRMMLPPGRNARLHGTSRLSIRVVTLNGAVLRYGARVCSGTAGTLSFFSVGRRSTGLPSSKCTHGIDPSPSGACADTSLEGVRGKRRGVITPTRTTVANRVKHFMVLALYWENECAAHRTASVRSPSGSRVHHWPWRLSPRDSEDHRRVRAHRSRGKRGGRQFSR